VDECYDEERGAVYDIPSHRVQRIEFKRVEYRRAMTRVCLHRVRTAHWLRRCTYLGEHNDARWDGEEVRKWVTDDLCIWIKQPEEDCAMYCNCCGPCLEREPCARSRH